MISANISKATRRAVYARDGWRCILCDSTEGLQVHHVILRSQGGSDLVQNLVTLCWKCHAQVHGTRMPEYGYMEPAELAQGCVEYIADYYADMGILWNPWDNEQHRVAPP